MARRTREESKQGPVVFAMAASATVYFAASEGIKNQVGFLIEAVEKAIRIFG